MHIETHESVHRSARRKSIRIHPPIELEFEFGLRVRVAEFEFDESDECRRHLVVVMARSCW